MARGMNSSVLSIDIEMRDLGRYKKVRKFWDNDFVFGSFSGTGRLYLRYAAHCVDKASAAVVIVSGRTEFMEKYAELLYDLSDMNLSLYIYDHRGQGSSARMLADAEKGHVECFNDYVQDLGIFIEKIVKPREQQAVLLLSHSMGGMISLLYGIRHQQLLKGLILSSPMLSINTGPFPHLLARLVSRIATLIGRGADYVFGAGPSDRSMPFAGNVLTNSRERFELHCNLVTQNPQLALGGPTFSWLAEALAATAALKKKEIKLQLPVLLLRGEADRVVGRLEQDELCERLEDCRLVSFPEALHEVLMEKDEIRNQALREIRNFISKITEE